MKEKLLKFWAKIQKFWPWIVGGLSALSVAIGVYYLKKRLMTQQVELARLRTAAEQAKVKATAEVFQANLEVNEAKKEQLKTQAFLANARAMRDLDQARAAEEAHKKTVAKVDAIKSWAELDAINKEGRS
jgi:hypothetical protein